MVQKQKISFYGANRLFWIGTGLMFVYYIADSAMDALLFGEDSLADQLLSPSPHELAIRLLSGTFLYTFFLFARHLITKNQKLQQELLLQSQELVVLSQEREDFTHFFSHELRTSLTCIYLAEQTFIDQHSKYLNDDGRQLLGYINDNCEKMSAQIDKMLDLTKILRAKLNCKEIEFNKLILDVAQEIRSETEGMTICVEAENEMRILCDPELMRLAVKSLCMSVVEYCKPLQHAEICIGKAKVKQDQQTFFVRNNSMNASKKVHFKLFGLHSKSTKLPDNYKYLNLAEAVIHRHGGRVWAEDTPEFRTTVFFSI